MKKRFLALLLALVLCLGLAVPAFAADDSPAPTVTVSGPGSEIPKETREFALRNYTEKYVPDNRLSAIHTDFTRNEEAEPVTVEDVFTLTLGTEVTVDGLRTADSSQAPWDLVSLCAWSDPDGDGIYDQRLFTGIWEHDSWTENNFSLVATTNSGPFTYREIDYNEHMPVYSLSLNACGRDSLTHLWRNIEALTFPSSVTLSAEYLTRLFGPNTLVQLTVDTYEKHSFPPVPALETRIFYGYIPEDQTLPIPAFTDVPEWYAVEAAWAAQQKITNGYNGSTTFAPDVECPHTQILTFLWRAENRPTASTRCPVPVASYYQEAVNWAYEEGLIGDDFVPNAKCTRADAVFYIWQARGRLEAAQASDFPDVDADAPYVDAVSWAVEKGVTNGYGGNQFSPDLVCTRGQIAAFLYRAYNN